MLLEIIGLPGPEGREILFELDMSYLGQTHTVDVPLPLTLEAGGTGVTQDVVRSAFEARYAEVYGRLLYGIPMRVLNLRVSVIGQRPKFDLSILIDKTAGSLDDARLGERQVWIDGAWHETAIYARLALPVGARIVFAAEVFDAITSPRPYQERLTPEEGAEQLRKLAGTKLDPDVVEALARVVERQKALVFVTDLEEAPVHRMSTTDQRPPPE